MDSHALSFGAVADAYERGRPGYPVEAMAWLLPDHPARVVDLGAGTGKATRVIVPLVAGTPGAETIAVEPDPAMRAQLERSVPGVRVLDGSGEHLPFEDDSVDAVIVAQAWHWVDAEVASREVGRVLRPGGVLGLVWNIRDERVPWVQELSRVMAQPEQHAVEAVHPTITAPFDADAVETAAFPWVHEQDRDAFVDMVASRSYISTLGREARGRVLDSVRHLLDTDPALAGLDTVPVPYAAQCFRAVLPERG
jgi:SAM-dependent methyltransferase